MQQMSEDHFNLLRLKTFFSWLKIGFLPFLTSVDQGNVNLRMSYFSRVKNFGYFIYFLNAIKARGVKSTDSRKRNARNSQ